MNLQRQRSNILLQDSIGCTVKKILSLKDYSAKLEFPKFCKISSWVIFYPYFNYAVHFNLLFFSIRFLMVNVSSTTFYILFRGPETAKYFIWGVGFSVILCSYIHAKTIRSFSLTYTDEQIYGNLSQTFLQDASTQGQGKLWRQKSFSLLSLCFTWDCQSAITSLMSGVTIILNCALSQFSAFLKLNYPKRKEMSRGEPFPMKMHFSSSN